MAYCDESENLQGPPRREYRNGHKWAVFVSYASEDAEAASRISEALRATGIEVWFDRSGLRGGDNWDASIRR